MIKSLSGNKNVRGFGVIGVSRLTRTNSKWQRLDLNQRPKAYDGQARQLVVILFSKVLLYVIGYLPGPDFYCPFRKKYSPVFDALFVPDCA